VSELFSCRIGFELSRGSGWIVPVAMRADWPLARFSVTKNTIQISTLFFISPVEVPWRIMKSCQPTWTGMRIEYESEGESYELLLYAPFLWSRFQSCVEEHSLVLPNAEAVSATEEC
jgi:hypothetical protein